MVNIADLAITSLETISAFNVTSGAYKWTLDELQTASIAQSQDVTEITGKQGRRITTLKRNKMITISGTNGLLSAGLLETQTGSSFVNGATKILWTESLTVTSNAATTTYKAIGTSGAEIIELYKKNSDGTLGTEFTQAGTAAAGKFTYNPSTKALAFYSGDIANGSEIFVVYKRNITADKLVNKSDKFSEKCELFVDCLAEDKCGNVFRVQIHVPKADFNGEFSWDLGDNQAVHSFEATSLAGACGGTDDLYDITIFGANTADTAVA